MSVLIMRKDNQLKEYLNVFLENKDELAARRALGPALAALPDSVPPADGWSALREQLQGRARKTRREPNWFLAGIGVAASVILVLGLMFRQSAPVEQTGSALAGIPLQAPTIQIQDGVRVASLMRYSQQLELQLRSLRSQRRQRVLSGSEAAAVDEMERMVGLVDLQLAAAPTTAPEREGLWRQRVSLMNQLVAAQVRPASMEL